MKSIIRVLASLTLILVLLFNTISCDFILPDNNGGQGEIKEDFYIDGPAKITLNVGESVTFTAIAKEAEGEVVWTTSSKCVSVEGGKVTALCAGVAMVKATLGDKSDTVVVTVVGSGGTDSGNGEGGNITVPGTEDPVTSDPYVDVDVDEFYRNYTPAISYMDAYYRTKHNLMSGSIASQDEEPTVAKDRPMSGGKYIRNNVYIFSDDGNTYYVVDSYGEVAFEVYKGGAYIVLEEVAAYVFAFGEPPANQSYSKNTDPDDSPWGKYLRVNNTKFSGSTTKYPYEPALPRISGCGGDLTYYEMDIGTTGTTCDPSYTAKIYNNGHSITRGAARIVYSCKDKNGNKIIDLDERYVFYTYNHYNDFQEYLNYEGGWGEIFGNVTGGGVLSSKYNYNPTPYVEVVRAAIGGGQPVLMIYYYVPKSALAA